VVRVPVGRRPRVGLLITGDELVGAGELPPPGCIRDSNGPALEALIRSAYGSLVALGSAPDRPDEIEQALRRGLEADALVTSGGVSEGLFDLVEPALERLGVRFHFTKVAVKPGAPFAFGSRGKTLVFALPGNPVSAQLTFELFVRPALCRMQGGVRPVPLRLQATLEATLTNKSDREAYIPVLLESRGGRLMASPLSTRGSADVVAHARASGLVVLGPKTPAVSAGESVEVFALPGFLHRGSDCCEGDQERSHGEN
jgi:molybdopterin molybdotransferase